MEKHRLPIDSLIDEIKHNCSKDKDNTYYTISDEMKI